MPSKLIGQPSAQAFLGAYQRDLPPVTLFTGPPHTGKKTAAYILMMRHAPGVLDRVWISSLTAESLGYVQRAALIAPFGGSCKVVVICLDGATTTVLPRLLKLLEEPPSTARFILISVADVPATLRSRSYKVRFGLLLDGDVAAVLQSKGMAADMAAKMAPFGGGQVRPAMQVSNAQAQVLRAVRAALCRNAADLATATKDWDSECERLLAVWCCERVSSRWRVFQPASAVASRKFAECLLRALAQSGSRWLSARAALEAAAAVEVGIS